jgi:imidazolonepropionase
MAKKRAGEDHLLLLSNAAQIVTVSGFEAKKGQAMQDLGIIEGGSILVRGDRIERLLKSGESLEGIQPDEVVDCSGKTILPGFVDSHTHLVFGGYRENEYNWRLRGDSYVDIMNRGGGIINSVKATREASFESLFEVGMKRLDSMTRFGVTTVEAKSGYGLDKDTEIRQLEVVKALQEAHSLDLVATFMGAHSVPADYKGRGAEFIEYLISEVMPIVREKELAEFCDIFCEKNVFSVEESRRLLTAAKDMGFKLKIHADEIVQLGGAELAAEVGAVSADHLLQASDEGIRQMAEAGVVATVLPCTAFSLKEHYARARQMIDQGCAVAVATDFNPGSCFTESVPLAIALTTLQMDMSIEEVITGLTLNGAAAVGRAGEIGSLDPGKRADLVVHEFPSYQFIPYHIGVSTVEKVIKNGRVIFDAKKIEIL